MNRSAGRGPHRFAQKSGDGLAVGRDGFGSVSRTLNSTRRSAPVRAPRCFAVALRREGLTGALADAARVASGRRSRPDKILPRLQAGVETAGL